MARINPIFFGSEKNLEYKTELNVGKSDTVRIFSFEVAV